jgi:Zn-dependent peptidase ImmA (M78 family)
VKLPHKIRITSKVSYELAWVDRFDDETCVGECRYDRKQIAMKRGQSEVEQFRTLIHELFHAVAHECDIEIPHKAIYGLEHAIERVLKLNGWMPRGRK